MKDRNSSEARFVPTDGPSSKKDSYVGAGSSNLNN